MNNRSIGVFDSGVGGLTAVKQIMKLLPNENIIYFGDTGRVPYGTRSRETIVKYTRNDIRFLQSFDVKMIVIACGTASSASLPHIKSEFDVPIIGVVDAAVKAAVDATKNKKIGVIGTQGTINSGSYERLIKESDNSIQTFARACPLFVPLVENGHFDTKVTQLVVEEYLEEIKKADVDTLILGCTHYPLLKKVIGEYMGKDVTLIDPGAEAAKHLQAIITEDMQHDLSKDDEQYRYFVSDNPSGFEDIASTFLETKIDGQVTKIDIEKY